MHYDENAASTRRCVAIVDLSGKRAHAACFTLAKQSRRASPVPATALLGLRRFHCPDDPRFRDADISARRCDDGRPTGRAIALYIHRNLLGGAAASAVVDLRFASVPNELVLQSRLSLAHAHLYCAGLHLRLGRDFSAHYFSAMKNRIILAGGSGFIGRSLSPLLLSKGYEVVVLTREPSHQAGAIRHVHWDGRKIDKWAEVLEGATAIVNLTGKNVNCRHTAKNRREILESRVNLVRVLGEAIATSTQPPEAFVQASGIAIYGDAGDRWCDEAAPN